MTYNYVVIDGETGCQVWAFSTMTEAKNTANNLNLQKMKTRFYVIEARA